MTAPTVSDVTGKRPAVGEYIIGHRPITQPSGSVRRGVEVIVARTDEVLPTGLWVTIHTETQWVRPHKGGKDPRGERIFVPWLCVVDRTVTPENPL